MAAPGVASAQPGPSGAPPAAPGTPAPPAAPPTTPAPAAPAETPGGTSPSAATPGAEATQPAADAAAPASEAPAEEAPSGSGLFEQSLDGDSTSEGDAGGGTQPLIDLNGYVRGDAFIGDAVNSKRWDMKAAYGELALKPRTRKETYGDAFADLRLRYGLQGDEQRLFIDLREAYVNTYVGPLDLRLGQQIIVWGRADAFNPTNNLTPFDLRIRSPLEDDRRLGNFAARAFLNFAPIRIEGVWVPLYRPAEIPVVVPDYATLNDTDFPKPEINNGTVAGRVHLELASFELSASYLYGYAPLPGLSLAAIDYGTPQPINVARKAYDHHVVGFDFSTAIGDIMGLRGEVAYRAPLHYEDRYWAPNPDLQYVLGIDKTFGSVSVIAQYMGRYVFDWEERVAVAPPAGLSITALQNPEVPLDPEQVAEAIPSIESELAVRNQMLFNQLHELQHLLTVRVEWLSLHDTLSLSALGFVNFNTEEFLVFPKIAYSLSDNLSTSLGAEIYAGPTGTLFGTIDEQLSAGYAELRYTF